MGLKRWLSIPLVLTAAVTAVATPAAAADTTDSLPLSHATTVGVHNAYQRAAFPYLADALDSGAGLIELDVWADSALRRWRVNHEIVGVSNNCARASTAAQLRTGVRNQSLATCLDNLRLWHQANPAHRPIVVKVELKAGFDSRAGLGPADFDRLVADRLGTAVYRPADLLTRPDGTRFADLDAAARAGNWATRSALAGKFLFEVIPGTFERGNPFDNLHTDIEYARHLRDRHAAGQIDGVRAFPAVLDAQAGDPRTRYADTTLRPWFVVFDGAANAYVSGGIDPAWYHARHYLLVMTNGEGVPPPLGADPSAADAAARVAYLAAAYASVVSTDWYRLPAVLGTVLPRG